MLGISVHFLRAGWAQDPVHQHNNCTISTRQSNSYNVREDYGARAYACVRSQPENRDVQQKNMKLGLILNFVYVRHTYEGHSTVTKDQYEPWAETSVPRPFSKHVFLEYLLPNVFFKFVKTSEASAHPSYALFDWAPSKYDMIPIHMV